MNEETRQRMIIRQNCLNRATDLLISEQEINKSQASIPIETIKTLTKELEKFIWELDVPDNRVLNPKTGVVEQATLVKKLVIED